MRYAIQTLKHKWWVLVAGLRLGGIPLWRLLIHDLSKFSPAELPHYERRFFGANNDPLGFALGWNHHENHNPHHWGYWVARSGPFTGRPLPMPRSYAREMVADWMGAQRTHGDGKSWDMADWLAKTLPTLPLHIETIGHVCQALLELGYLDYTEVLVARYSEMSKEWR
jgi:hypothetical protein